MEPRNIFEVNLPTVPAAGPVSKKKAFIAKDEQILAEKQEALAKLQASVKKAQEKGLLVDASVLKRIARLEVIIKEVKERIVRETERLHMLCR